MDSTIIAGIISAFGGITGTFILVYFVPILKSKSFRRRNKTPDILGTWENEWFIGDKLYTTDFFEIDKWIKNNKFQGIGSDDKIGRYMISGEIHYDVFVATYEHVNYPTKGYIGTFTLKLSSAGGNLMEGCWHGFTRNDKFEGGKVICKRKQI